MTILHGDKLECVGGPWAGESRTATALFPWAPDLINVGFSAPGHKGLYILDREASVWRWKPEVEAEQ